MSIVKPKNKTENFDVNFSTIKRNNTEIFQDFLEENLVIKKRTHVYQKEWYDYAVEKGAKRSSSQKVVSDTSSQGAPMKQKWFLEKYYKTEVDGERAFKLIEKNKTEYDSGNHSDGNVNYETDVKKHERIESLKPIFGKKDPFVLLMPSTKGYDVREVTQKTTDPTIYCVERDAKNLETYKELNFNTKNFQTTMNKFLKMYCSSDNLFNMDNFGRPTFKRFDLIFYDSQTDNSQELNEDLELINKKMATVFLSLTVVDRNIPRNSSKEWKEKLIKENKPFLYRMIELLPNYKLQRYQVYRRDGINSSQMASLTFKLKDASKQPTGERNNTKMDHGKIAELFNKGIKPPEIARILGYRKDSIYAVTTKLNKEKNLKGRT